MKKQLIAGIVVASAVGGGIALGVAGSASATPDSTYYVVQDTTNGAMSANGGYADVAVNCNAGDTAISGGFANNNNPHVDVQTSAPVQTSGVPTGWSVSAYNYDTTARSLYVHVVCKDT